MINFIQGRHMIDFRFLVKKSLAVVKFMLLPVLLHTAAVKAEVTYIHTDYLGSVSAKSNASGQVIERFHYAPFGLPADSSELNNKQSYTGHVFDNESQLIYMQARYYDPVIGRFYSNDPINALEHLRIGQGIHGFNRYAYGNNNPYAYNDPDGKQALPIRLPPPPPVVRPTPIDTPPGFTPPPVSQGTPQIELPEIPSITETITEIIEDIGDIIQNSESAQDKRLTAGEARLLELNGYHPHDLKPSKHGSRYDLFKDKNGNVVVKPKNGQGEGEPTGINLNNLD